jgi:hypothetical protein
MLCRYALRGTINLLRTGIGVDFFRKTCFYGEGSYTFVGGV